MRLIVDTGNTRTKTAIFIEGELVEKRVFAHEEDPDIASFWRTRPVEMAIVSTVADTPYSLSALLTSIPAIALSDQTPLPFEHAYRSPSTLGRDRIAAVAGGIRLYPGSDLLIIDAGSCITYEWVEAGQRYLGGNISPGLQMRYRAMHAFTARLPQVPMPDEWPEIGVDTGSAMQAGGMRGVLFEIEGYISAAKERYPEANVIMCGGNAVKFGKHLKNKIFVQPDLLLYGLDTILTWNANAEN